MNPYRYFALLVLMPFAALRAQQKPNAILQQTKIVMGLTGLKKPVLHYYYNQVSLGREESDRTYPPFFTVAVNAEAWFATEINTTRIKQSNTGVGRGPAEYPSVFYLGVSKHYAARDTAFRSLSDNYFQTIEYDKLNAWAVVLDWAGDPAVRQGKNEVYRDYERLVLERPGANGKERLFIDPKTNFPVKLDYQELSSLWGQQHIEVVYSNWQQTDDFFLPASSFRLEDGEPMIYRTMGKSDLSDSLSLFSRLRQLPVNVQGDGNKELFISEQPKLIKFSDQTYLTKNRFYTEVFTKIGDTVYLLDATLNEARARQDEKLIRQVFPGADHFVVVVTDLAWPHVGGLRYWVSKGATIVSHSASRQFLDRVVHRRWTIRPDELQKHPRQMKFVPINKMTRLAKGALQVFPIDGIGSEGALACNLPKDKLLWASDYIQDTQAPTAYASEVIHAVNREKLKPAKVVAQHIELVEWQQVVKVNP